MEDLNRKDISVEEVQQCWSARRSRMAQRRQYFEPLWRNGINQFFEGILSKNVNNVKPLYNTLYEQYDFTLFSRDGLRFSNIRYPLIHAVTMRALATEIPNKPKVNFIALNSNDQTKPRAFSHLFAQVLYEMDAAAEDFEIFLDKRIFGSSVALVLTENYDLTVNDPEYNYEQEKYTYTKKTKKIRQCLYKKLDLRHVYFDEHSIKTNLTDCNYAQVDEYFSKEDFKIRFADYDQQLLERMIATPMQKEESQIYSNLYDTKDATFMRVTHSFDKLNDRYHILVNGLLLNDIGTPIPRIAGRRGKEIPLALTVQYKIPGAPYGYGDSHITTTFNYIKNLMRLMILEITQKSAKPLMAVDPLSSFNEESFEWGMDFIRVAPNELREIKTNPDLKALYDLDSLTDQDIMRITGINISDTTSADVGETARKTVIRRESQNALIELTMNYMSNSFFKRLYTLLKDDVRLHYSAALKAGEEIKIMTKGAQLRRENGGFEEEKVKGFRYFDLKSEDIDFDMELDLELGNIASSRELDKALANEGIDASAKIPQGFSPDGLAKWIQETYNMPEDVLANKANNVSQMDPKELANKDLPPEFLPEQQKLQQAQQEEQSLTPEGEQTAQPAEALPPLPQAG